MNRIARNLSAAVLALVCGASALHAQTPGSFGVAFGGSVPVGDLGDFTETGFYVGGLLDISPPLSPVGFRFEGFYNGLGGANNGADYRTIAATGNLTIGMGGIGVRPYLIGGAGIYNSKFDVDNVEGKTSAGLNFGIGAKIPLTGFSTFVEGRVHYMFQKQESLIGNAGYNSLVFVPVTFGITF